MGGAVVRTIFVCHSRDDHAVTRQLMEHLDLLGYRTLTDDGLRGGSAWWTEILERIVECDAFLPLLSGAMLETTACRLELEWADLLGKPLLPVVVESGYRMWALPASIANLTTVNYFADAEFLGPALKLARALESLPDAPPVPHPLPDPPVHPYRHLTALAAVVYDEGLAHRDQRAALEALTSALASNDPEERHLAREVLRGLRARQDLFADVATSIAALDGDGPTETAPHLPDRAAQTDTPVLYHDDVQFTVYRPKAVRPGEWATLLAFAHLGDAPEDDPDPTDTVRRIAETVLGPKLTAYRAPLSADSVVGLPDEAEVTFHLEMPGCDVQSPHRTFLWVDAVHHETFKVRAPAALDGQFVDGHLLVTHGVILLADIALRMRVNSAAAPTDSRATEHPTSAAPYRRIFPSYSRRDSLIVAAFEDYLAALGDTYLTDVRTLRSGEEWSPRLEEFIREADVFQLFWSQNSMNSTYVEKEWRYAVSLGRPHFIRPTFWEQPMPPIDDLPREALGRFHFHQFTRPVSEIPPSSRPFDALYITTPLPPGDQATILVQLRQAFTNASDESAREQVREHMRALRRRPDTTYTTVREIDAFLAPPPPAPPPPGFSYPPPRATLDDARYAHPSPVGRGASMSPAPLPRSGRGRWLTVVAIVVLVVLVVAVLVVLL